MFDDGIARNCVVIALRFFPGRLLVVNNFCRGLGCSGFANGHKRARLIESQVFRKCDEFFQQRALC